MPRRWSISQTFRRWRNRQAYNPCLIRVCTALLLAKLLRACLKRGSAIISCAVSDCFSAASSVRSSIFAAVHRCAR